jgi:hypothetical protein
MQIERVPWQTLTRLPSGRDRGREDEQQDAKHQ